MNYENLILYAFLKKTLSHPENNQFFYTPSLTWTHNPTIPPCKTPGTFPKWDSAKK